MFQGRIVAFSVFLRHEKKKTTFGAISCCRGATVRKAANAQTTGVGMALHCSRYLHFLCGFLFNARTSQPNQRKVDSCRFRHLGYFRPFGFSSGTGTPLARTRSRIGNFLDWCAWAIINLVLSLNLGTQQANKLCLSDVENLSEKASNIRKMSDKFE